MCRRPESKQTSRLNTRKMQSMKKKRKHQEVRVMSMFRVKISQLWTVTDVVSSDYDGLQKGVVFVLETQLSES